MPLQQRIYEMGVASLTHMLRNDHMGLNRSFLGRESVGTDETTCWRECSE